MQRGSVGVHFELRLDAKDPTQSHTTVTDTAPTFCEAGGGDL